MNRAVGRSGGRWLRWAFGIGALSLPTAGPPVRPTAVFQTPTLSLSANPLTAAADSVVLHWPKAASGPATVAIYSLLGTPVVSATLDPDPGRWVWYGRTGNGASVTNGAYIIVVVRGDGTRMRRRIIVEL